MSNQSLNLDNLQSSLQYFDFSEMTPQEILDKFEETLCHREKQIKELSSVIGALNMTSCAGMPAAMRLASFLPRKAATSRQVTKPAIQAGMMPTHSSLPVTS